MAFKKNITVGVSVTPDLGLEVAQIDFVSKTVLKYGCRPLVFDNSRKDIADLDIFKETLNDLFFELEIPKGTEIVLSIPTVIFRVNDYPAALSDNEIQNVVEEDLLQLPIFEQSEAIVSIAKLPNSTIQFNKIAYVAAHKASLIEIAMQIKDLGYKLVAIDTSINSTLNSLIYNERVNVAPDVSWTLLLVDNSSCTIIPMQGRNYVDCFEERISIGEVLGDEENYATVINAIDPILKNVPSQYLYIVSKTNAISAEALANKITYNGQIIHQEANKYNQVPLLEISENIDENLSAAISLDVIGASIYKDFIQYSSARINLYNASLGDVYINEQPPAIKLGSINIVLSLENMLFAAAVIAVPLIIIAVIAMIVLSGQINQKQSELDGINSKISAAEKFLEDNKNISSELFDEADEIRIGLVNNKAVYSYYTIVGTEIPKKLWLTSLRLGEHTTIEGQSDNLESIYSFFRNIKDYNPSSQIKLQRLGLASRSGLSALAENGTFDTDSILTSLNADFYEFSISDTAEDVKKVKNNKNNNNNSKKQTESGSSSKSKLPDLEPLE